MDNQSSTPHDAMQRPPIPLDEKRRIQSVHALHLLDTPAEERFDRITRIAQRLFDVPIVAISLIDETRQWFKSCLGTDLAQVSREVSFCGHTIALAEGVVVEDARRDLRFADNPLVVGDPYLRFYAGHPLPGDDGSLVGTLALFDYRPRQLSDEDLRILRDMSALAANELRVSKMTPALEKLIGDPSSRREPGRIDALTRLWNRSAVLDIVRREVEYAQSAGGSVAVLIADVDQLKRINDRFGTEMGDVALREVAKRMRTSLRPYDSIGRFGGEEFLAVLPGTDGESSFHAGERIRVSIANEDIAPDREARISVTVGLAATNGSSLDADSLVRAAERALYDAKTAGGNRVHVAQS